LGPISGQPIAAEPAGFRAFSTDRRLARIACRVGQPPAVPGHRRGTTIANTGLYEASQTREPHQPHEENAMPTASKTAAKKAPAKKSSSSAAANEAVKLLTADHREVRKLFKEYEKLVDEEADDEQKKELAEQICDMLTVHATIEEEIFYPAARGALEEQDLLDEAEVEHASAKDLISQIQSMEPEEELYDAKVKVLGEYVEHHVKEEEGEMFPKLNKADLDLDSLAQQLLERKQALMVEMGLAEQMQ
jgi:hemerythrin superfamily protein